MSRLASAWAVGALCALLASCGAKTALELPPPDPVVQICSAQELFCALYQSGRVVCWGTAGTEEGDRVRLPRTGRAVEGLRDVTQLECGALHACALVSDGGVWCWGSGHAGELGYGVEPPRYRPARVPGVAGATQVAASGATACAVTGSGRVMCWGTNTYPPFGFASRPYAVADLAPATQVAMGDGFECAIVDGGRVQCWGARGHGVSPPPAPSVTPVFVTGVTDAISIAGHFRKTCVIRANHELWCWGQDSNRGPFYDVPTRIPGGTNVVEVAVGGDRECVLRADGVPLCIGLEDYFPTVRSAGVHLTLTPVPGIVNSLQLRPDPFGACLLESDHTVTCWGNNPTGARDGASRLLP